MIIQHNIMALNSYNRLSGNNSLVSKNLEKLSSGYKINRAGDDAAGLAISEKMRAQITGLTRATQNSQDGISLVQTAEGQLTEVHSMLNRMVDLATQASNGTIDNETDRKNLQKEVQSLKNEINRIAETSHFNGIKLLDGSMGGGTTGGVAKSTVTVGAFASGSVDFSVSGAEGITVKFAAAGSGTKAAAAAWSGKELTITLTPANSATPGSFTQSDIDAAIKSASGAPEIASGLKVTLNKDIAITASTATTAGAISGATVTTAKAANASFTTGDGKIKLTSTKAGAAYNISDLIDVSNTTTAAEGATVAVDKTIDLNLEAGKSYTANDINKMLSAGGSEFKASFDGALTGAAILTSLNNAVAATTGGAGLDAGGGLSLQIGDTADQRVTVSVGNMSVTSLGLDSVDVSLENLAKDSIDVVKKAINTVSSTRADLGAIQNRLEHTINNLTTTTENMTAAEARIRDTDMAKEMMAFTKNNVLAQAAQAMLAQANQQPQQVLQLLR